MIIRSFGASAVLFLTACAPAPLPDSNPASVRGAGFRNYDQYAAEQKRRDAMLEQRREAAIRRSQMSEEQAIAAETLGALNISEEQVATVPVAADGTQVASVAPSNPEISDEQNFDAVAERQSIESDAERLERNRQTYQVAAVEAVPENPGSTGPNIVAYALSTSNPVGTPLYERRGKFDEGKYRRACAEFGSADQAQIAFLESGGPKRDRKGLDPDGDGFACFWNPTPFRSARGG
ncbi:MAG: hypothetical protein HKN27_01935 [Silicimonas sp.]|nr:hypothetical protein [Silicimonas sp.]